jgi:hypothetical protein
MGYLILFGLLVLISVFMLVMFLYKNLRKMKLSRFRAILILILLFVLWIAFELLTGKMQIQF